MSTDQHESSSARRYIFLALKLSISIVLLVLLFRRIDVSSLWAKARSASPVWLAAALGIYGVTLLASTWRWHLLLDAQKVPVRRRSLLGSFMVANFFNNFLPSNIGGDVIRITDTAPAAGSKTLATTVVLIDRGIGLLGLALVAAMGASAGLGPARVGPVGPGMLWAGFGVAAMIATPALLNPEGFIRILQPLRVLHPEWVGERLERLTAALSRFKESPASLASCFAGAIGVQVTLVAFYLAIAHSLRIPITFAQLAVIVPISFIVQMVPVSMNGFGVREATFGFYFTRLGLPLESALLVSFIGAGLVLLFSLSGGVTYLARQRHPVTLQSGPRSA